MTATDLRVFRARFNLTQGDLAEMLGFTRQYVNMMEKGERRITESVAAKVAALSKLQREESQ